MNELKLYIKGLISKNRIDISEIYQELIDSANNINKLSEFINYNFDVLNSNLVEEIILKIYPFTEASENISSMLIENFNSISDRLKKVILEMSSIKELSRAISVTLTYKFYSIPKDFRDKMLSNFIVTIDNVEFILHILKESYSKIPHDISKRLLIESCKFDYAIFYKMKLIQFRFEELSKEEINILLTHLSNYQIISKKLVYTIKKHIKCIDNEVLFKSLYKFLDYPESRRHSVMIIRDCIFRFSKEQKEKIFLKLIENQSDARITGFLLSKEFENIDSELGTFLLQKLSLDKESLNGVTACLLKFEINKRLANEVFTNLEKANYSCESLTLIKQKYSFT